MSEVWSLPGYDVQALLGFGGTGEVWRARELATGETVALKRLRDGADPAAIEALRREANLLRTLDTPYVVRLREVVGTGAGAVLVLDHAPGGSLATLLSRRGALDPGEAVTIGGPLAQALAAAHARGLVHGDVTPSNVLFTADGMPLLADLGVARFADEDRSAVDGTAEYLDPAVAGGGAPGTASDVWALAAVLHHVLTGAPPHEGVSAAAVLGAAAAGERAPLGLLAPSAPRALVAAVEAGLVADPADRPDAAAFASLLRRAHAAAPVQLTGGIPTSGAVPVAHETRAVRPAAAPVLEARRRRLPQGALPAAGLALLLVAAGVGGWLWGRGEDAQAQPLPAPVAAPMAVASTGPSATVAPEPVPVPEPDWAVLLDELDAARAAAFAGGDVAALARVWAPGSAGLAGDTALLQDLAAQGRTAQGLRHEVRSLEVLHDDAAAARLRVVDVLAPYQVRDAAGAVVSRAGARGETAYSVGLVRIPDGWRLVQVVPTS